MGGSSIRDFLIAMLAGTVTGVYSSVFVASQILVSWDEGDIPRIFRRLTGRSPSAKRPAGEAVAAEA